jgi:ABC-type sulfate transport system permease component
MRQLCSFCFLHWVLVLLSFRCLRIVPLFHALHFVCTIVLFFIILFPLTKVGFYGAWFGIHDIGTPHFMKETLWVQQCSATISFMLTVFPPLFSFPSGRKINLLNIRVRSMTEYTNDVS